MTLGMMMSLTYIIGQVSAPIGDFIGFAQSFQDAKISLERLNEMHLLDDEETDIDKKLATLPLERDIEIKNVSFSYNGSQTELALNDVSLSILARKVTAIVGESGCGKTTLIKLLQGFYTPMCGSIMVGGTSLSDINPHTWRAATGSVMQDSFIFSDTIAGNIAVNTDEIDKKQIMNAARMACIDDFVKSCCELIYSFIISDAMPRRDCFKRLYFIDILIQYDRERLPDLIVILDKEIGLYKDNLYRAEHAYKSKLKCLKLLKQRENIKLTNISLANFLVNYADCLTKSSLDY